MNSLEKVRYVKNQIHELAEISPSGPLHLRLYTVTEYEDGPTLLSVHEQHSIIKRLQEGGLVKDVHFDDDGHGVSLELTGSPESTNAPIIREQTLEKIAQHLGDLGTGGQIVSWLKSWGVPDSLIEYPNTKWRMVRAVLSYYAHSSDKVDHEMLFKIICEILHPMLYDGDMKASEAAQEKINKYLEYDGWTVLYSTRDKKHSVYSTKEVGKVTEEDAWFAAHEELLQSEYDELQVMRLPENREKISALRKTYQMFINIVEVFCQNPSKPSAELNDAYLKTKKMIQDVVYDLHLYVSSVNGKERIHRLQHYCIPFTNLYTAERDYTPDPFQVDLTGKKLSWDYLRPQMHATYGEIDELYRTVEGSDVLSKPDVQQTLNDVSLLLSKTKERDEKNTPPKAQPVQKDNVLKVEIVGKSAITVNKEIRRVIPQNKKGEPFVGPLQKEQEAGDLAYYNDGSIRFRGQDLPMRAQLKDICRLFIKRPNQLITSDDIYDVLEKAIPKNTISKYVSELHSILRASYGRDVLISEKKTGWKFNP